ncbi:hypothetical protein V6N11_034181 [Hibiscus sabdariffa]|uniref:Uncharacterized protein n=1 Tax=Hibiscus sabdariffa TaxID=183260 RepID=A0ABR2S1X4_9ROSI
MFQPTSSSYDKDFPPLEEEFKHAPKIPTPLHGEKTSAAEATLNWQTENAIAQNTALQRIDSKVTQMGAKLTQVEVKVDGNTKIANELIVLLHKRLQQVEKQTTPPGQDLFYYLELKEKEIQTLKEQIRMLEETGQVPQPLKKEEFIQSLRRGPPPKPQPSIFASLRTEVTSPSQSFMFDARSAETKKPTTYEIYHQIKQLEAEKKRQEAERKRERDRKGKTSHEEADPSPKASRALMVQGLSQQNPLTSFLKEYRDTIIPKIAAINQDSEEEEEQSSD